MAPLQVASYVRIKYVVLLILLYGCSQCIPTDAIPEILNEGELIRNDRAHTMGIVPSGKPTDKAQAQKKKPHISELVDRNKKYYRLFMYYVQVGIAHKALTFNMYHDLTRDTTVALFHMLLDIERNYDLVIDWLKKNVHEDMLQYAWRAASIFTKKYGPKETEPPFITQPQFFVNGETIVKALRLKINNGNFDADDALENQFYRTNNIITLNANYSGWNPEPNNCNERLDYFTEDISLNSYYLGIQLLYPFWMTRTEINEFNPRHGEHYYFAHRQLLTRYALEKEHLKYRNITIESECENNFRPHLVHKNGLPFPVRSDMPEDWNKDKARLRYKDRTINEMIKKKIFYDNGARINITQNNYMDLLTAEIRVCFDDPRSAKHTRNYFGYGGSKVFFVERYNPAPTLLHYPETTLRDPFYWKLMEFVSHYYTEYTDSLEPFKLSNYETEDIDIINHNFTEVVTLFDYYQFNVNNVLGDRNNSNSPLIFTVRQKRLKHLPFTLKFSVASKHDQDAIVRLFIGPECYNEECWGEYSKFYQLDIFKTSLQKGLQHIYWSPENSTNLSFDEFFNMEMTPTTENRYNLYKFPDNLLLPKGLEEGLNLTLFIMITPADDYIPPSEYLGKSSYFGRFSYEFDNKLLGFPFHRKAVVYRYAATNYKFFNFSIFHKKRSHDIGGTFSSHLM